MQDILRNVNWEKDTCGTIKIYFYYKGQDCIYQKKGWDGTGQNFKNLFVSPGGQGNGQPT